MGIDLIHVIDDDPSIRRTLEKLFASVGVQARSYETAQAFLSARVEPDVDAQCLILDVRMPGLSGLDFQEQLLASTRASPIIMMTAHADVPMSVRAMKAGAIDFLPKPFRDQEMLDAAVGALEIDRRRRALADEALRLQALYDRLTPRERQVMGMVTAGRLNKQVAGDLELSMITVKIHRKSVMQKMQARTLSDLVRMAAVLGIHSGAEQPIVPLSSIAAAAASLAITSTRPTPPSEAK